MIKKIIDFIKVNNWIFIILSIIFMAFILFGGINKCSTNHTNNLISQIERTQRDKFVIDSINKIYEVKIISSIDSTNKKRGIEISVLKQKVNNRDEVINKQKIGIDTLLDKFNKDSTQHTLPNCEKIVEGQSIIIKDQDVNLKDKSSIISKQDTVIRQDSVKYFLKSNEVIRVRDMYKTCEDNSNKLIKELQRKDNWWGRNEK